MINATITPTILAGKVSAIPSKSHGQRMLIASYLAGQTMKIPYPSKDFQATTRCLKAMEEEKPLLSCGESGATLRFLLPIAMVKKTHATFQREGRLAQRPLFPLTEEMEKHGCQFEEKGPLLRVTGKLRGGNYFLPGNVSSQYITGLLMALPLTQEGGEIQLTSALESQSYVALTLDVLRSFSLDIQVLPGGYRVGGNQRYRLPKETLVEGDWSNGAFWVVAKELGMNIQCTGLSPKALQGDKAVISLSKAIAPQEENRESGLKKITIDGGPIPDLIPILAIKAALAPGETIFTNLGRLRLKESDRLASTAKLIHDLGGQAKIQKDALMVYGKKMLRGGTVDGMNDHRIVMAAAIAATKCRFPVTILGAHAVEKSYPTFFQDYEKLGGKIKIEEERK